jgi:hypothetical protein
MDTCIFGPYYPTIISGTLGVSYLWLSRNKGTSHVVSSLKNQILILIYQTLFENFVPWKIEINIG